MASGSASGPDRTHFITNPPRPSSSGAPGVSSSSTTTAFAPKPKKRPSAANTVGLTSTPSRSVSDLPMVGPTSPPPADGAPDLTKIRAYAACKSCRTKKIKCLPGPSSLNPKSSGANLDTNQPPGPCQQCVQSGSECTYPPTRDRAAYSRQYVQNLEGRVQALEMVQNRLMPLLEAFEGGSLPARPPVRDGVRVYWQDKDGRQGESSAAHGQEPGDERRYSRGQSRDGYSISPTVRKIEPLPDREDEGDNADLEGEGEESDDPVEDTGQMTQDERGNYRWIGSNNTLSLLDSFSATPHPRKQPDLPDTTGADKAKDSGSGGNPYFAPVAGAGVIKALPTVDEVMYPSPELAERFIDAYFAEIHPILPVMIEHEFRKGYAAVMERRSRGEAEQSGIFISVIFAVFALGERVLVTSQAWVREKKRVASKTGQPDEDVCVMPGEAEAGVIWYERAQILRYTTITDISLHQVQALTLMAAFQASVNAMPMSWLLCGMALRMAQDLGLHRSTARLRIPFQEKQVRARCWWAAYGLDRLVSLTLGRPVGVDDQDIDVAFPSDIDDQGLAQMSVEPGSSSSEVPPEPNQSVMSGFTALSKLCRIAGRINHALYRPSHGRSPQDPNWVTSQQGVINKLDKSLREWLDTEVPSKYKDPSQERPIQLVSAVLSNSYFACLITLHRNFLSPSPDSGRPRAPPSTQSLSHCVAAARSVIHIAAQSRVLLPPSHHLALFTQYLWSAAVLLLLCEVQAKDQVVIDAVGSQVESTRRSLAALEPVWPGTRKLKELLIEAERRAKEVVAHDLADGPRAGRKRKTSHEDRLGKRPGTGKRSSSQSVTRGITGHGQGQGVEMRNSPNRSSSTSTVSNWNMSFTAPQQSSGGYQGQSNTVTSPSSQHRPSPNLPPRLSSSKYETSDTRTLVHEDYDYPRGPRLSSSSLGPGHNASQGLTLNNGGGGSGSGNGMTMSGYMSDINPMGFQQQQQQQPVQDFVFDIGGVDFNGLEMLQGFQPDFATLWSSLMNDPYTDGSGGTGVGGTGNGMVTPAMGTPMMGQGQGMGQGQSIGGAGGGGSNGPSPHGWTGMANPQLTPTATPGGSSVFGNMSIPDISSSEFWSAVAGAGQDWGADPNVPFNI